MKFRTIILTFLFLPSIFGSESVPSVTLAGSPTPYLIKFLPLKTVNLLKNWIVTARGIELSADEGSIQATYDSSGNLLELREQRLNNSIFITSFKIGSEDFVKVELVTRSVKGKATHLTVYENGEWTGPVKYYPQLFKRVRA
jgi:hypothetical protein